MRGRLLLQHPLLGPRPDELVDRYYGLDLSDAQFPAQKPDGKFSFAVHNILDPPPEPLKGKFDLVHLRLLVCGLPPGTWGQAVKNLSQLLRPGGWMQWIEAAWEYDSLACLSFAIESFPSTAHVTVTTITVQSADLSDVSAAD